MKIHQVNNNARQSYAYLLAAMQQASTIKIIKTVTPKEIKTIVKTDYIGKKINIYI